MKDKNGFTLIELLAVIAILGLLVTIAGFSVTSILKKSKKDVNDVQASRMVDAAKLMVMENPDLFDTTSCMYPHPTGIDCIIDMYGASDGCKCMVTKDGFNGYLDKTENITGCVFVYYNPFDDDFTYEYRTGKGDGKECANKDS